jgi:hypothetical protein
MLFVENPTAEGDSLSRRCGCPNHKMEFPVLVVGFVHRLL